MSSANPQTKHTATIQIMKKYYYADKNAQSAGPVYANQLLQRGVTANTPVWCAGMKNWDKASNIEELKPLFLTKDTNNNENGRKQNGTEPKGQLQDTQTQGYKECCTEDYKTLALASVLCFWPLGIIAILNAMKVKDLWNAGECEQAKEKAYKAKLWTMASMITGAAINAIAIITLAILAITQPYI